MKCVKVIDYSFIQVYSVQKPSKDYLKVFPKNYTNVTFNLETSSVMITNVDNINYFNIQRYYNYVFSLHSPSKLKKVFKNILVDEQLDKEEFIKRCGVNGCNQNIYTNDHNVVISLFSTFDNEYSPCFVDETIDIATSYDKLMSMSKDDFHQLILEGYEQQINRNDDRKKLTINKLSKKYTRKSIITDISKILEGGDIKDKYINWIINLRNNFPLNYQGSIRRFHKIVNAENFSKCVAKKDINNLFYIGYDVRYVDIIRENKLVQQMEGFCYNDQDVIYLYETYTNPITDIITKCKQQQVEYKQIRKKCISIKYSDYGKIKLNSSPSNFV